MNLFFNNIFERIITKEGKLATYNKKATLFSQEIQTSIRLMLPGKLAKHTVSEGTKVVTKFSSAGSQIINSQDSAYLISKLDFIKSTYRIREI